VPRGAVYVDIAAQPFRMDAVITRALSALLMSSRANPHGEAL
jgi:hypothetical protein